MKNIKIYPKDWLQLHPYKQSDPTDSYYTNIANRIYGMLEETRLAYSFEKDEVKQISIRMAAYFEDVISGLNIWRSFITEHKALYGKFLPFYTPDDHYYDDEVNYEDIRFLLWHYTQQYHGFHKGTFVSPDNAANGDTAKLIYQMFCDEWTTAPENERLQQLFAPETRYEDVDKYNELLHWFHYQCYLFTDSHQELTDTVKEYWEQTKEKDEQFIMTAITCGKCLRCTLPRDEPDPPVEDFLTGEDVHEGAEAQERAERDGHFAQGRFAGHQAGDEQKGGKGRDARDQRDQRQAEGPAQDAEHEHEFDVAEPHAVHAAQAFEDKKYGEERPAAHKAAEKGVRPVHAEGEDGGGHGQHCPAERDAVGKDKAFQIDARGDDEHSREHEIDGKGERGAETPCQKAGRQAGQELDERIPDMDGLVAAGALAAQQQIAEDGDQFPEAEALVAMRAMGRWKKDGFAADVPVDADVVKAAEQEPEQRGGGNEHFGMQQFRGDGLVHAEPSFGTPDRATVRGLSAEAFCD